MPEPACAVAGMQSRHASSPLLLNMIDLKNKCALITGGSAGLGAAVCKQLAAEGANLIINYAHSAERANVLAEEIRAEHGVRVAVLQGDVFSGNEAAVRLVQEAHEAFGQLDIVISNAGWTKIVPYDDLDALDDELWDGVFAANVKSHFYLFREAKKFFDQNEDGGTFIVSASVAGRMVYGSSIPYAVSKSALIHLVRFLATTQGPKVRVHAVCPGLLLTEWGERFPAEKIEATKQRSPLKTLADVDETAAHFVFLCKLTTSTGTTVGSDAGLYV